jgi:hypothetical protein
MNTKKLQATLLLILTIAAWITGSFLFAIYGSSAAAAGVSSPTFTATVTTEPDEAATITCKMDAYVLVTIDNTSQLIFVYVAQGMHVKLVGTEDDQTLITVPIGGQDFVGRVPAEMVVDCEAG